MGIIIKMRFLFACIIAMTAATPVVQGSMEETTSYVIDGIKGAYDGYYSAFYKSTLPKSMEKCLDESSIKDIVSAINILSDPIAIFTNILDFSRDVKEFQAFASVFENLSNCPFEESAFDIFTMCTKQPGDCMFNKLMENLTKNMFVLVGKVTSLAETFQGFPAKDGAGFKEQMKELGQDAGTWVTVIFNYKKIEETA